MTTENVFSLPERKQPCEHCEEVKAAMAYGYAVHAGRDEFDEQLRGKWWWTLSKPGWIDCVTDPDEHDTEAEAWVAAVAHHKAELMLDNRESEHGE